MLFGRVNLQKVLALTVQPDPNQICFFPRFGKFLANPRTYLPHNSAFLTLSKTTNYRLFQIQRVSDNYFEFDENGGEFSISVENTVGKGEIAHFEQFLLFPTEFQKICIADKKQTRACLGKGHTKRTLWVNNYLISSLVSQIMVMHISCPLLQHGTITIGSIVFYSSFTLLQFGGK